MTDLIIQKYLDYIKKELEYLKESKFTGHMDFSVNLKLGGIANMNIGVNQSIKMNGGN